MNLSCDLIATILLVVGFGLLLVMTARIMWILFLMVGWVSGIWQKFFDKDFEHDIEIDNENKM